MNVQGGVDFSSHKTRLKIQNAKYIQLFSVDSCISSQNEEKLCFHSKNVACHK